MPVAYKDGLMEGFSTGMICKGRHHQGDERSHARGLVMKDVVSLEINPVDNPWD